MQMRAMKDPIGGLERRFRKKFVERGPDECWVWEGGLAGRKGYGVISYKGKNVRAHRLAWELANGPIPNGLFVCHHCDNPPCVNPNHLFLGTATDNAQDMCQKGRWANGVSSGAASPAQQQARVAEIRERYTSGDSISAISLLVGMHKTTVARIVRAHEWTPPTDDAYLKSLPLSRRGCKLNGAMAVEIWKRLDAGEKNATLAKEYGVHPSLISDIRRGRRWASAIAVDCAA
jgi:hypothetical protein